MIKKQTQIWMLKDGELVPTDKLPQDEKKEEYTKVQLMDKIRQWSKILDFDSSFTISLDYILLVIYLLFWAAVLIMYEASFQNFFNVCFYFLLMPMYLGYRIGRSSLK